MLHHHSYMRHLLLSWPDFPETYGENYCIDTVRLIRKDPYKWLMSLPMYEYAHVLTVFTAHNLGGEGSQYVTTLHNRMMMPILTRYYKDLELYRYRRAMRLRRYDLINKDVPGEGVVQLKCKMKFCTAKTRAILCQICEEYKWLKDLSPKHPKTLWLIEKLNDLARDYEYEKWMEELQAFLEELKDKEVPEPPVPEPDEPDPEDPPSEPDDPDPEPDPPDPDEPEPEHSCNCNCERCSGRH